MQFRELHTEEEVREHVQALNVLADFVVVDTETTDKDPRKAELLDIQLSGLAGDSAVLFQGRFAQALLDLEPTLVLHNFDYDWRVLHKHGVDMRGKEVRDTMLMHHLLDENSSHSLNSIVQARWQDNYKEVFWSKNARYQDAPKEERLEYACKDIIYTARVYREFIDSLRDHAVPTSLLVVHVHALAASLLNTEIDGVGIDLDYLLQKGQEVLTQTLELQPKLRRAAGGFAEILEVEDWAKRRSEYKTEKGKANCPKIPFNFDSNPQLQKLLYQKLKLEVQHDPKTKSPTTGDSALQNLEKAHPIVPLLRLYRGHQKVFGSYIDGTLERVESGRIYPEFNVNGTKTGRISHSNPNLGQLPSEGGIRGIYVPDEGHLFISSDYKQLEVVLAAHFSRDTSLLRVVEEGASLHDITAEGVGVARSLAKTLNFALQYGAGIHKVRDILGCSQRAAEEALAKYWQTYAGLKDLIDACHRCVDRGEPIINPYGRRRHFPKEFAQKWEKEKAYRQSFNALIQGTGGDLTSRAFYLVDAELRRRGIGKSLFSVHDEIIISAKEQHAEEAQEVLTSIMSKVGEEINLSVPLKAEGSGPMTRWED